MTTQQRLFASLIVLSGLFASSGLGCEEEDRIKQKVVGGVLYTSYYDDKGKWVKFTRNSVPLKSKISLDMSPFAARAVVPDDWSADLGPTVPIPGPGDDSAAASLAGGQVLFAGGFTKGEDFPTAQAFLYDDAAAAIHALPDMMNARRDHRMTRLADNTVLITGGFAGEIPDVDNLTSAERFDPVSRTFKAMGAMNVARARHAAALLANGWVLVVAGDPFEPDPSRTPTAELFDPASETFSLSNGSPGNEWEHAVTLNNGKVLLVGANDTTDAQLYDPATDLFLPTGSMTTAHGNAATATLLDDGRVLIAGGWDSDGDRTAATELYNPDTGLFAAGPTMNNSRYGHVAIKLPDGNVLIAGGVSNEGDYLDRFEIFDPNSNTFTLQNSRLSSGFAFGSGAGLLP